MVDDELQVIREQLSEGLREVKKQLNRKGEVDRLTKFSEFYKSLMGVFNISTVMGRYINPSWADELTDKQLKFLHATMLQTYIVMAECYDEYLSSVKDDFKSIPPPQGQIS